MRTDDATAGMLRYRCEHCHAEPGQWCTTPSGRRPTFLHSNRFYQWRDRTEDDPPGYAWPSGLTWRAEPELPGLGDE